MRYIATSLALIFFVTTLFHATSSAAAESYRVMRYVESFPPYYFPEESEQIGIVQEIFAAIANETGDTFKFIQVPYKRALYKFETGQIDIEPMSNPEWRKNSAIPGLYSIPFAVSEQIILYNARHYLPYYLPEDLLGKTMGTIAGYTYPVYGPYLADGRIKAHPLKNENKLIKMLLAGRLHQSIMNKDFALYRIKMDNLRDKLVVSNPCNAVDMMIRVHPSKRDAIPKFNKAIRKLLADGTIQRIYEHYR